jgi:hypothetical protein
MNFKKWLEFSDQGGEVSYNHMNNVVAGDDFDQLDSKYMAPSRPKRKKLINVDKIFGKKKPK